MVFTPLSIRRGVGGEAVDGLVERLLFDRKKRFGEHIPSFGGAWGGCGWLVVSLFLPILKYSFCMIETQFYVYLCSLN